MPLPSRRWPIVLSLILLGCAGATAPTRLTPSTTQLSASPRMLRFVDAAVPIDRFRDDDHDVDLSKVIHLEKQRDLYFGQADRYDAEGNAAATVPLIVARGRDGSWAALNLADPRLPNADWQLVAAGPGDGEIWGVLDDTLTSRGKVILLAHSADSGATWTIAQVAKPFETGDYDSFAIDKSGHGRLSVYIAPTEKHPSRAGFYHFRTSDSGKSWSKPEHESDGLDPADEVPADEQPEPLKSVPAQTAQSKHEIRNPKSETNGKFEISNLEFRISDLFRISDFVLRILTFPSVEA